MYKSRYFAPPQTFGEKACHPEPMRFAQGKLREGSGSTGAEILRFAQGDSQDTSPVRLRKPSLQTSESPERDELRPYQLLLWNGTEQQSPKAKPGPG